MVVNWTEKRLKRLKLLNKEGFSATIIAEKLGPAFTKGIVLRKLHLLEAARLEGAKKRSARKASMARPLSRASKDGKAVGMVKAERVKASPPVQPLEAAPIRLVAPALPVPSNRTVLQGVRLLDLRNGHCRWPLGEERPATLFCGAPAVGTTSWCEHHQRMAFSGTWRPAASARLRVR
ncbi:MAG TPA: GcrA family cell cycle regulator [Beijerinckiaceae bacterium]|jgi:hypothetical protein|nr:GcrA family cell cycle regulator [Beijerinckiaceae bacterium]